MKTHKIIKSDTGRITIQTNSGGIPEIKVRMGNETHKLRCHYQEINEIIEMVEMLISFNNK
jgi:hypothetical protein